MSTAGFTDTSIDIIREGGIGVMPTDTVYGIVGSAHNKEAVLRIYKVRQRDLRKPFIVLVDSLDTLFDFGIELSNKKKKFLQQLWPAPVSVLVPCTDDALSYLHRGTGAIAFRIPKHQALQRALVKTGPLVAPSANMSGQKPARTLTEARNYFGDTIDFYEEGGEMDSVPSTLVSLIRDSPDCIRDGAIPCSQIETLYSQS